MMTIFEYVFLHVPYLPVIITFIKNLMIHIDRMVFLISACSVIELYKKHGLKNTALGISMLSVGLYYTWKDHIELAILFIILYLIINIKKRHISSPQDRKEKDGSKIFAKFLIVRKKTAEWLARRSTSWALISSSFVLLSVYLMIEGSTAITNRAPIMSARENYANTIIVRTDYFHDKISFLFENINYVLAFVCYTDRSNNNIKSPSWFFFGPQNYNFDGIFLLENVGGSNLRGELLTGRIDEKRSFYTAIAKAFPKNDPIKSIYVLKKTIQENDNSALINKRYSIIAFHEINTIQADEIWKCYNQK